MVFKMVLIPSKVVLLLVYIMLLFGQNVDMKRTGKDFHSFLPPEEEKIPDYQVFQYSQNYPYKHDYAECVKNPMLPLLGRGLNLLLLKLGVFGIIKAVIAVIFLGFLVKVPLLLLKLAFVKSFFFPFLIAPLMIHMFTSHMNTPNDNGQTNKPGETSTEMPGMMGMNEMTMDMGRQFNDNLTSMAWQSVKMFVETDQCVERISCMLGASSKDSALGNLFTRMLKYLHYSSPPATQKRIMHIREAFNKGSRSLTCLPEDYECQSPELLLQYGVKKIKIL